MDITEKIDKYLNEGEDKQVYMMKALDKETGKTIDGWKFKDDPSAGSFYFEHPKKDFGIAATPFWEGEKGMTIEKVDDDGISEKIKEVPFSITGDEKKDVKKYFDIMKKILKKY